MDPDEVLRLIRRELDDLNSADDWTELAGYVEALDGWLSNGGFPPRAWAGPNLGDRRSNLATPREDDPPQ